MKSGRIIITLTLALLSIGAMAQHVIDYQSRLQEPILADNYLPAGVNLYMDESSARIMNILNNQQVDSLVAGYRIGIFLSNGYAARTEAEAVIERCERYFKEVPTTLRYDNPYFKVSAGYCITLEEAVILLNKLSQRFPRAYLVREQIPINCFSESWQREVNQAAMADSLSTNNVY